MTLNELIEAIRAFEVVVVTGPQRSGTTIATKILAALLSVDAVFEETFKEDDILLFGSTIARHGRCVVQAPAMSGVVQLLKSPSVCVVFMRRSLDEVIASQERIGWTRTHESWEKAKYNRGSDDRPIALLKEEMWREQKRLLGARAFDLDYESLASSKLWVKKDLRKHFGPRQTSVRPDLPEEEVAHRKNVSTQDLAVP